MTTQTSPLLVGATITCGPQSWQVLQRDADGYADVRLEGTWAGDFAGVLVRVVHEHDQRPVVDWVQAEELAERTWQATLRVPTGGPYQVQARGLSANVNWLGTGDNISHVFVGDIWVVAGQSNAVGYGHGIVVDPPAIGVSLCGRNGVWRLATHPLSDPTGVDRDVNREGGPVAVSPWLAFAREIWQATGVPIGLVMTAYGGAALQWWMPEYVGEAPSLFSNMERLIEAAGGRIAGMTWYQGSSDASAECAPTYLERFAEFVGHVRARYGAQLPIVTVQLNRVLVAAPESDIGWSLLREAQRQASRTLPNVAVVPTLDLPLSDLIHISAAGCVLLGQRCACIALGMVYGRQHDWRPLEVREARFIDNERTAVRIDFDHVTFALSCLTQQPGDVLIEDDEGSVPIAGVTLEQRAMVVNLARKARGDARCHLASGSNPPTTVRDHRHWPALACYGVRVLEMNAD
jgi:hypothetical protein